MNCKNVQPLLSAYIDQELEGSDSLQIREHLRTCVVCQREFESLKSLKSHLRQARPVAPRPTLEGKLKDAVFAKRTFGAQRIAVGTLIAATSMAAALVAVRLAEKPQSQPLAVNPKSAHALDAAADRAYLTGSDPVAGGVPVVTVSYAGDH